MTMEIWDNQGNLVVELIKKQIREIRLLMGPLMAKEQQLLVLNLQEQGRWSEKVVLKVKMKQKSMMSWDLKSR